MPKVKAVLYKVFPEVQVTKDFKRRNFVATVNYMGKVEFISFELFQDHCKFVDSFNEGDKITVDYNVKGRKWTDAENNDKYFNTLQAWKLTKDTSGDD